VATVLEPYRTTARYSPHIAVLKPREDCELESVEPSNALWWADPAELVGCRKREYASKPASASSFASSQQVAKWFITLSVNSYKCPA